MMYFRIFYIVFFLFVFSFFANGQSSNLSTLTIRIEENSIQFQGNNKTNSDYLLRELNLEIGESYTYSQLEVQVNSLKRLNGLYDADLIISKDSSGKDKLIVTIIEQITLLPLVNFGFQEQNRWFQIGLVDINLRGRGDELYSFYQNNQGRHSGLLYYKNNNVLGSRLGFHLNALRWHSLEPLNFGARRLEYEYKNNLFSIGLHYRLSGMHLFEVSTARFNEVFEKINVSESIGIGPNLLDLDKILNKLEYNMNLLLYDQIYLKGSHLTARYQNVYTYQTKEQFNIIEAVYKHFLRPSQKINLAFRGVFGIANNNDSPFSPFLIDSYQNIRGVGDRVLRGTALLTANAEARITITEKGKWATQAIAFVDAGIIRTPGMESSDIFTSQNHRESIGIGARIHYKKIFNAVFRLDYGVELVSKKGHFVIGLGQYF